MTAAFAALVGMRTGVAAKSRDRGGRDDRSAAGLLHFGHRVFHPDEYRAQQYRLRLVPVLDAGFLDGSDCASESGIVKDDVEFAEFA